MPNCSLTTATPMSCFWSRKDTGPCIGIWYGNGRWVAVREDHKLLTDGDEVEVGVVLRDQHVSAGTRHARLADRDLEFGLLILVEIEAASVGLGGVALFQERRLSWSVAGCLSVTAIAATPPPASSWPALRLARSHPPCSTRSRRPRAPRPPGRAPAARPLPARQQPSRPA